MKQIVISILKTVFKIIKAVLCVAGVMAVILFLEVTKNIIKDKENGDTNDSQEISIEVSRKIPVQQVEQENDNNKQHYATLQEASQHTEVFTEEGGEYDTQIEHIIAVFENSKEVIAAYQSAKSPKQMHVYEELAHFQISKEDEKRKYLHVRSHTKDYYRGGEYEDDANEMIRSELIGSDYTQSANISYPSGRFAYGDTPKCMMKKGEDIRKLRVEGQKPDGIIEHKHFGEIWYFWYFTDLQSDKSGQKLNYTLGAEEDE